jgi:TRAP-type C4-dicarboxylate transport system permease small subunit
VSRRGGAGGAEAVALRTIKLVSRALLVGGGLMMAAVTVLIVVEIVMRQGFKRSLGGVDELAGFALAVATSWSFAAVLLDRAHVRIDSLYARFGQRLRALLDILSLAGTVGFIGTLTWFGFQVFQTSLRFNTSSQSSLAIPKAVPQGLWVAGLAWFCLVAAVLLVLCLVAVSRRDWAGVARLAGAPELDAEVAAERDAALQRGDGGR